MTPDDPLAVPYVIAVESVEHADGQWVRRAWHPELPGCEAQAESAWEAIELLEAVRERYICSALATGEFRPARRAPLRSVPAAGPTRAG
ncbi:MAG: hypothetical protein QOH75_1633 [Actinomycetota bacterium]|jgi:predicted RNase H-like HicB family nuclease|nr:hypothetical protein [Actinomycetota bacterium]